ncbi:MAG: hypothetical protein IKV57_04240 [Clostridia bacterium]|nr:hypothetical protein [Clostridia bacterium]
MKHNLLTALLAALLAAASMTACGGSADPADTTTVPETEAAPAETEPETDYLDVLEVKDMNGRTFAVFGQSYAGRQNFYLEEKDGDAMNDALRARDLAVEERLNISLVYEGLQDRGQVKNNMKSLIMAGDETYQLVVTSLSDGINTLSTSELLYDLRALPYLQLEKEYWNKSMYDNMTFYGKQYFSTGAISLQYYLTPIVMQFNKQLAEDYQAGDIYEIVRSGEWTVDKLIEIASTASHDLNGDGSMTTDDFYGLVVDGTFGNVLYNGAGFSSVAYEGDNCVLTLDSAASIDFIDKCAAMFGNRDVILNDADGTGLNSTLFRDNRTLFITNTVLGASGMRDMEEDFGIIPTPKSNESQEFYMSSCNTWLPSGIGVPSICSTPEETGLILETMAYISDQHLRSAVYDVTLQGKVSRDEDSAAMLDLIYARTAFDFNTVFDFGGTSILLRECVLGEQDNFSSRYASVKTKAQTALDDMLAFAKE